MALSDIQRIEVRRMSAVRTIALVPVLLIVVAFMARAGGQLQGGFARILSHGSL